MAAHEHDTSVSVPSHDESDIVSISGGPQDIGSEHVTNEAVSNSLGETFTCGKCGEDEPLINLHPSCKHAKVADACAVCIENYRAIVRRWKKEKKLKPWFQAKSEEEKEQWYKEHKKKNQNRNKHQKFDLEMTNKTTVSNENRNRDWWKPWHIMRRDLFCEGISDPGKQLLEFRRRLMSGEWKVRFDTPNNQWLICEWQGRFEDSVNASSTELSVKDTREGVTDQPQMEMFLQDFQDRLSAVEQDQSHRLQASASQAMKDLGAQVALPDSLIPNIGEPSSVRECFDASLMHRFDEMAAEEEGYQALLASELADAQSIDAVEAKKKDPVVLRLEALKMLDKLKPQIQASLDVTTAEAFNVKEFALARVLKVSSGTDLNTLREPWKETLLRLTSLLDTSSEAWEMHYRLVDELKNTVHDTSWNQDIQGIKDSMKQIWIDVRKQGSHYFNLKRAIQDSKNLIQKHNKEVDGSKGGARKRARTSTGSQDVEMVSPQIAALQVVSAGLDAGAGHNVLDNLSATDFTKPVKVSGTDLVQGLLKGKPWPHIENWMESMGNDGQEAHRIGSLNQAVFLQAVQKFTTNSERTGGNAGKLTTHAFLASGKMSSLHTALYGLQAFTTSQDHLTTTPLSFGLCECRCLLDGEQLIIGIVQCFKEGEKQQRGDIASRDGASLLRLASEPPNFFMHVGAEEFVFLPAGFLYTVLTMRDAKGVRWSFSPVNETITETTRRSLAASMDAYASLRATKYKEFYDFLDNSR